jgi:hypothetical protein
MEKQKNIGRGSPVDLVKKVFKIKRKIEPMDLSPWAATGLG